MNQEPDLVQRLNAGPRAPRRQDLQEFVAHPVRRHLLQEPGILHQLPHGYGFYPETQLSGEPDRAEQPARVGGENTGIEGANCLAKQVPSSLMRIDDQLVKIGAVPFG